MISMQDENSKTKFLINTDDNTPSEAGISTNYDQKYQFIITKERWAWKDLLGIQESSSPLYGTINEDTDGNNHKEWLINKGLYDTTPQETVVFEVNKDNVLTGLGITAITGTDLDITADSGDLNILGDPSHELNIISKTTNIMEILMKQPILYQLILLNQVLNIIQKIGTLLYLQPYGKVQVKIGVNHIIMISVDTLFLMKEVKK